ncbi:uncharacterized protein LOC122511995 [Leptopilina heterotoma]|uniref:uncharacterized protein LOC122511995 n=1 Tax=Leptopilina heterotoma TaxID=63436 RepID=UPI001CAA0569|nr:uncharacterized protein LOC122511995 [Leptopilina heterotoma]
MMESCDIQRGVKKTVKDGLTVIEVLLKEAKAKHVAADESDVDLACVLSGAECNRKDRKEERERSYRRNLKSIIRDAQKRKREGDSPEETRTKTDKRKKEEAPPMETEVPDPKIPQLERIGSKRSTVLIRVG